MTITEDDDKLLNDGEDLKADEVASWSEKVFEKYNTLRDVAEKNIPNLWPALEFALSVKTILNIRGCIKPFAGILLGPPSSLKTVTIGLFRGCQHTFYSDNFTAKSFVSHNSAVKKDELKKVDLLPKIKNNFFLTPELAPMFAAREEDLLENLGIITRVLDGEGYENDTGAQGHRGYKGEYMFTWLGASVDIPHRVHKALSTLGPRLFFLRLPKLEHNDDYYLKQMGEDFEEKLKEVCTALYEYIAIFETHPQIAFEDDEPDKIPLPKIPLDHTKDEESAQRIIIKLGKLLAPSRAEVPTWEPKNTQGSEYGYTIPTIEEPIRAIRQLSNLAWGHALSQGRNYMNIQDISMIIQIVLSTCSIERETIFELLLENRGVLNTSHIVEFLNVSKPTALRTMTELKATGLVDMEEEVGYHNSETEIRLSDKFDWFLSEKFAELLIDCKENCPPRKDLNPILLLIYYSIINKKTGVCIEKPLQSRGGQKPLQSNNVIEDIPSESWNGRVEIL